MRKPQKPSKRKRKDKNGNPSRGRPPKETAHCPYCHQEVDRALLALESMLAEEVSKGANPTSLLQTVQDFRRHMEDPPLARTELPRIVDNPLWPLQDLCQELFQEEPEEQKKREAPRLLTLEEAKRREAAQIREVVEWLELVDGPTKLPE
jgi:hypothetical protein